VTSVSYERIGFVDVFFETGNVFFTRPHKMSAIFVTFDEKRNFLTAPSPFLLIVMVVVQTVLRYPWDNSDIFSIPQHLRLFVKHHDCAVVKTVVRCTKIVITILCIWVGFWRPSPSIAIALPRSPAPERTSHCQSYQQGSQGPQGAQGPKRVPRLVAR